MDRIEGRLTREDAGGGIRELFGGAEVGEDRGAIVVDGLGYLYPLGRGWWRLVLKTAWLDVERDVSDVAELQQVIERALKEARPEHQDDCTRPGPRLRVGRAG